VGAATRDDVFSQSIHGGESPKQLAKALHWVGASGYQLVGMTDGKTALDGNELVAITRPVREQRPGTMTEHTMRITITYCGR
jgi:hypothetical protein